EWRAGGAFLLVAAHMQVGVASPPIGQPVDEPGIAVEREYDGFVGGEQRIEVLMRQTMRMLTRRLQLHKIDDVDDADLQLGRVPMQEIDGSQCLERRNVTTARHHDIGLAAAVVAGPLPDAE